jgi:hypothetical protein
MATRDSQDKKCGNPKVYLFISFFHIFYIIPLFQCPGFFNNNNNNRIAQARCPHCEFQQCRQCSRKVSYKHNYIRFECIYLSGIMNILK